MAKLWGGIGAGSREFQRKLASFISRPKFPEVYKVLYWRTFAELGANFRARRVAKSEFELEARAQAEAVQAI